MKMRNGVSQNKKPINFYIEELRSKIDIVNMMKHGKPVDDVWVRLQETVVVSPKGCFQIVRPAVETKLDRNAKRRWGKMDQKKNDSWTAEKRIF